MMHFKWCRARPGGGLGALLAAIVLVAPAHAADIDLGPTITNDSPAITDGPIFPNSVFTQSGGIGGSFRWTIATGPGQPQDDSANWTSGGVSGRNRVEVFIPSARSSGITRYHVDHNGGRTTANCRQTTDFNDRWVAIGRFNFSGTGRVIADDFTGSAGEIAWDAARFIRIDDSPAPERFVGSTELVLPGSGRLICGSLEGQQFEDRTFVVDGGPGISARIAGDAFGGSAVAVDDVMRITVTRPNGTTAVIEHDYSEGCRGGIHPHGPYDLTGLLHTGENRIRLQLRDQCTVNVGNNNIWLVTNGDHAPPTVVCGQADDVWHPDNQSVTCTASDQHSGLAAGTPSSFQLTTTVPDGTETANAATGTRVVCDRRGNCVTAGPVTGFKIDRRDPLVDIDVPADGATYQRGQPVEAAYGCTDAGSGIEDCDGTVAVGALIDTSTTGTHTFTVTGRDAVGNTTTGTVTYTVAYDAPALSVDDVTVDPEGGEAVFTLRLDHAVFVPASVFYATEAGTASAGSDFTDTAGAVTFAPGQTVAQVAVPVHEDAIDELDERFSLRLSEPTDATIADDEGVATIRDDDTAGVAISDTTVDEGDPGDDRRAQLRVSLDRAAERDITVTVEVTTDGLTGVDITEPGDLALGRTTHVIPAGTTEILVDVPVTGDEIDELDEVARAVLVEADAAVLVGEARIVVADDDTARVSIADAETGEGNPGDDRRATVSVTLDHPAERPIVVGLAYAPGTASASDFGPGPDEIVIAAGSPEVLVEVRAVGDLLDEPDETVIVTVQDTDGEVADGSAVVTIRDDDEPPVVSVADLRVDPEGDSGDVTAAELVLELDAPSGRPTSVDIALDGGTATHGDDLRVATGTVSFAPGETRATVPVEVVGDVLDEIDETLAVVLGAPVHLRLGDADAQITIVDDDDPPHVSIGDTRVDPEGGPGEEASGVLTVTLDAPSGKPVEVSFATRDGAGLLGATAPGDYAAADGTVLFAPGETTKTVEVVVAGDALDEFDESAFVDLSDPVDARAGDMTGEVVIVDDDAPPTVSIADAEPVVEGDSGQRPATLAIGLSAPSGKPISIRATSRDVTATATAPADYDTTSVVAHFAPLQEDTAVTVSVNGDVRPEPDETFAVDLSEPVNTVIADASGIATIVDDERAGAFGCRASVLRAGDNEVRVANPPEVPCRAEEHQLVRSNLGGLAEVQARVGDVRTKQSPASLDGTDPTFGDHARADTSASDVVIRIGLNTIRIDAIEAHALARCGQIGFQAPELSGSSRVAGLSVNGVPITVDAGPRSLAIAGLELHLNRNVVTDGRITRRALQITLPGGLGDVVVAEAIAGGVGAPCADRASRA